MVHAVTEDREVDVALSKEKVVLVVTVSVDKGYHAMDNAKPPLLLKRLQKCSPENRVNEIAHDTLNFLSRNFVEAHFLEGGKIVLVLGLVKLIHGPEASPKEKEVKLLHFFVLYDR